RGIETEGEAIDDFFEVRYASEAGFSDLNRNEEGEPGIILGEELALSLNVDPDFEDRLLMISPVGDVDPTGQFIPRLKQFRLIGIFKSGFYDYDTKYALISYSEAVSLFPQQNSAQLLLSGIDFKKSEQIKAEILKLPLTEGKVSTWQEQNKKLFQALRLEQWGMFLMLSMIVLIASITIFGMLSLIILEKTKESSLLQAIGLTRQKARAIFWLQGLSLGIEGTLWGGGIGLCLVGILSLVKIPLPPSYYIDFLPVAPNFWQIGLVLFFSPLLALLTALIPALQVGKGSLSNLLRYE
ncbi:MAG: FtsX-like permease family protein, partial [bacterium]|nr:FtsX-like permease family protein [bacterium]